MDIVVSGIRSTGKLHLGNYFGAVKNFIKMQYEHTCYFFIFMGKQELAKIPLFNIFFKKK